ncbi:MAG: hypothetical protein M0R80_09990 [Proteobacteria bacterium]|nr:hypothetical protein [Pseudomonadota bacterium]
MDRVEFRKIKVEELPENYTQEDLINAIDYSDDGIIQQTICHPTVFQRVLNKLGLFHYLKDAPMDYEIQRIATSVYTTYGYISVGISSSSPTDYTLNNLVSSVLTRVTALKGYETLYVTNDTATFIGVFTPDGTYTIVETGLHTAATSGYMGYRQTSCSISTTASIPFAIFWKVTIARG